MGQYWLEAARGLQEAGWTEHQNFSGDLTKVDQNFALCCRNFT